MDDKRSIEKDVSALVVLIMSQCRNEYIPWVNSPLMPLLRPEVDRHQFRLLRENDWRSKIIYG